MSERITEAMELEMERSEREENANYKKRALERDEGMQNSKSNVGESRIQVDKKRRMEIENDEDDDKIFEKVRYFYLFRQQK